MNWTALTITTGLALALGGCASGGSRMAPPPPGPKVATADLRTAANADVGTATAEQVPGGVKVTIDAHGLPPGVHGVHVHTTGACVAPDFTSAGGHWNPGTTQHGSMNPMGPHAGDLPNLIIGADGRGSISMTLPGGTFEGLMDADGSALVVHAGPDDLKTDPSGNSGGRIACGVFRDLDQ